MKVTLVYVYPAAIAPHYTDLAIRFIESYNQNPPGIVHDSIIALNGSRQSAEIECMFSSLQNVTFMERSNDAFDVGAYQEASARFPADFMVFFGSSGYIRKPNWLMKMATVFNQKGVGLVGTMGNRGAPNVQPHIRTTSFGTSSHLMNAYPHRITRADQRYFYEHGSECFTTWIKARGLKVLVVDGNGREYAEKDWDSVPNGFHKGQQQNLLCGDRLSCGNFFPHP